MPFRLLLEKDFIGRGQDIETLYGISSEVRKGITTSIFLSGQHGIGKTEFLRQLFTLFFWKQNEVAPFFYTVNPALTSAHDFSMDYLSKFVRQRLAFQKKESSLIHADGLSIKDLMRLAEKSDAHWAVDTIGSYLQTKTGGDAEKLFLCAISAPYHSYLSSGIPVVVIIDEFQRTREFYRFNPADKKNLWMLFEELIESRYTPHIITGSQAELQEMFFHETSFGKSLELVNLSGLDKNASIRLFTSLCGSYDITVDKESLPRFVGLFKGNPFYIRNFIQAARREGKNLSENDLWTIYFNEITNGKIYTYWVSRLRTYMPQLELRKASLELLYYLCNHGPSTFSSSGTSRTDLTNMFSINREDLNSIVNLFQAAGIIEVGFSTFKLAENRALINVIKGLYSREVIGEPLSRIEEIFIKENAKRLKTAEAPSFEITIPTTPQAELIAVKTLEQIAKNQNISTEVIGQLQTALIDLFINIITQEEPDEENFYLKFQCSKDTFKIEIRTPYRELVFPAASESESIQENLLIRKYIDDIKFEKTKSGTKIVLIKNLAFSQASSNFTD